MGAGAAEATGRGEVTAGGGKSQLREGWHG
jgi:hypothetical protein